MASYQQQTMVTADLHRSAARIAEIGDAISREEADMREMTGPSSNSYLGSPWNRRGTRNCGPIRRLRDDARRLRLEIQGGMVEDPYRFGSNLRVAAAFPSEPLDFSIQGSDARVPDAYPLNPSPRILPIQAEAYTHRSDVLDIIENERRILSQRREETRCRYGNMIGRLSRNSHARISRIVIRNLAAVNPNNNFVTRRFQDEDQVVIDREEQDDGDTDSDLNVHVGSEPEELGSEYSDSSESDGSGEEADYIPSYLLRNF